ncbi:hypothetical protein BN2475_1390010 [Paraburkholderia ribeironis]|uniref:Uncharacterized protein n=1 Tax=Paraburkholderia ribeironis TaxID=1247936 RepID=A0A1N7SPP8_9BURK|nr:hypothetical protein BN2475_1390010 [Paraburkholderia ribeironis]
MQDRSSVGAVNLGKPLTRHRALPVWGQLNFVLKIDNDECCVGELASYRNPKRAIKSCIETLNGHSSVGWQGL